MISISSASSLAEAVFVDIDDNYRIDIEDLDRKAAVSGARFLMLSYMRGHIPDMDAVMAVCTRRGLTVVEDCAHTMGAGWNGHLTGRFGAVGCFSTQTFKHINSGEGGLIVTDDDDIAARAVLFSGSYMLYAQHRARPPLEVFERHRYNTPADDDSDATNIANANGAGNCSGQGLEMADLALVLRIGKVSPYQPQGMGKSTDIDKPEIQGEKCRRCNQPDHYQRHLGTGDFHTVENEAGERPGQWFHCGIDRSVDTGIIFY